MKLAYLCAAIFLGFFTGCGQKSDSPKTPKDEPPLVDYQDSTATGKLSGTDWTANVVEAMKDEQSSNQRYVFRFYSSQPISTWDGKPQVCDRFSRPQDNTAIVFRAPLIVGEHNLGPDAPGIIMTMTFSYKNPGSDQYQNLATDKGKLRIDTIDGSIIKGHIIGKFDNATYINGAFSARICN